MRVAHTARGLAAGSEPCDVLVVGGGPAGSTAARLLAQLGWTVRLLDRARFPRPKPCGECLNPGAVAALERLGVLERVLALQPASLDGWTVSAERAVARGRFPHGAGGLSLDRARLDAALLDAARAAGVEVVEGTRVTGLVHTAEEKRAGTVAVLTAAPGHPVHRARIVVGADGLRSVVARALSAYRRSPRLRKLSITLHVEGAGLDPRRGRLWIDGEGTVGLAALDPDGRSWNATAVVDADARWRATRSASPWRGSPPCSPDRPRGAQRRPGQSPAPGRAVPSTGPPGARWPTGSCWSATRRATSIPSLDRASIARSARPSSPRRPLTGRSARIEPSAPTSLAMRPHCATSCALPSGCSAAWRR